MESLEESYDTAADWLLAQQHSTTPTEEKCGLSLELAETKAAFAESQFQGDQARIELRETLKAVRRFKAISAAAVCVGACQAAFASSREMALLQFFFLVGSVVLAGNLSD